MSKSLDNYIGINEPAEIMFEKCMKVPDHILSDYFCLTTDVPEETYSRLMAEDIRQAHFAYACEIVGMYHGEDAAQNARQRYLAVASGQAPQAMDVIAAPSPEISVIELIKLAGFAASNSEARRLIEGKGIKLNGEIITAIDFMVRTDCILSRGKNKFAKVEFK